QERKRVSKDQFCFLSKSGKFLKNENAIESLHRVCRKAGLRNIGWHTLRHTFASRLAANNIPIIAIKELLGHSDIKMTMRYAHLSSLELRRAITSLEKPRIIDIGHNMATVPLLQKKLVNVFERKI
ncbi:MAG: tyrosine-type recombinase/integrase, partial [Candidatus Falkowbacteria bacterium]|nr:tyrosine-type recombinase/integrase [Candidatus Falkowbacteria bacterium]